MNRGHTALVAGVLGLALIAGCSGNSTGIPTGQGAGSPAPTGSSPAPPGSSPAPTGSSPAPTGSSTAPPDSSTAPTGSTTTPAGPTSTPPGSAAGPDKPVVAQALRSDLPRGPAGGPAAAGSALNSLGAALLGQLPAGDNAVLSPYSVYAVLAMAGAGAQGTTAAQLDQVLSGGTSAQSRNLTAVDRAVAAALTAGQATAGAKSGSKEARPETVDSANSVWLSPALPVHPAYLDALATGFGVGMYQIDYAADPEAARQAVNAWVGEHTRGKIAQLFGSGAIKRDTVMTLVNAMYLSAPWATQFESTAPVPFTTAAGRKISTPGMKVTATLVTASGPGWQSVTIPYRGDGLAMTLVVPGPGSFDSVRRGLAAVLADATSKGRPGSVQLIMPLFKTAAHLSLKSTVQALGITDIFDGSADLSGIAGAPGDLRAGDLVHQAVISVDDQGTEAAAATGMNFTLTSVIGAGPKQVDVDRPFIFSVHDISTGAPLFLGQLTDPSA